MKLIRSNKFNALASLIAILVISNWVSGCAGFAEPLPTLSATPNNVSVTAAAGTTGSQVVTLANTGTTNIILTHATVTGAGFTTSGLTVPMGVAPGATQNFMVKFSSTGITTVNGTIVLVTDGAHRPVTVQLKGQSTPSSAPVSSVSIAPAATSVATSGKFQFTASIQGTTTNTNVNWSASAGTITPFGLFTAPTASGVATVTATSVADPTKSAVATVTITSTSSPSSGAAVSSVTVTPSTANSAIGGTLPFSATVAGSTTNKTVTWSAVRGRITATGIYTAPTTATVDTVMATSNADVTKSASVKVTVTTLATSGPGVPTVTAVIITPAAASSTTDGTLQFSATVQGTTSDKSLSWKAVLGEITASGAYRAPSKPGTDTVTATSDADTTKSNSVSVTVSAPASSGALPAFPGAQGGGAAAAGGRGGIVMEVTNQNDSGTGSFRACATAATPRTCVFRVAGLFSTDSEIEITNPYLTIACQSAPGQVIFGGPNSQDILRISTHDVITRYCTFSPDNPNVASGPSAGTVGYSVINTTAYNIIGDHLSSRWAGNKEWLMYAGYAGESNSLTTMQWSMIYEPHEGHPVGPSTSENDTTSITQASSNVDFHHNLLVNIDHRIPEINEPFRWVNNVTYNYSTYAVLMLGAAPFDVINNIWDYNNLAPSSYPYPIYSTDGNYAGSVPGTPSIYVAGNIGPKQKAPSTNQFSDLVHKALGENVQNDQGPIPSNWQRSTPMPPANAFPIIADPAVNLWSILKPTVGNSQHVDCNGNWVSHRDPEDTRIVTQYDTHGTGGFWPNGTTEIGVVPLNITPNAQWQDHPQTGFQVCAESMHDGIPDQWKTLKGLSTTDPNLATRVAPNGYTWLENYLNAQ